jgi:hypothetical protein
VDRGTPDGRYVAATTPVGVATNAAAVHRYFLWSKAMELTLGNSTQHLARLGAAMAQAESYPT